MFISYRCDILHYLPLCSDRQSGLIGCMRDLEINDVIIEPRYVVKTERVVGEVSLDNCKYIDPCKRPNTCEHGGEIDTYK